MKIFVALIFAIDLIMWIFKIVKREQCIWKLNIAYGDLITLIIRNICLLVSRRNAGFSLEFSEISMTLNERGVVVHSYERNLLISIY